MGTDPLDKIRAAVLESASAGTDPSLVMALLLKISGEIALTTYLADKETYLNLASQLWDRSQAENVKRVVLDPRADDAG